MPGDSHETHDPTADDSEVNYTHITRSIISADARRQLERKTEREYIPCLCDGTNQCYGLCLNYSMSYECDNSNCKWGVEVCGNRRFAKADLATKCVVKKFHTYQRGFGLQAEKKFDEGELIIEYVGELITAEERVQRPKSRYIMGMPDQLLIDAINYGNLSRFINHSCDPNCVAAKWLVEGLPRLGIFRKEGCLISPGDELTLDYSSFYDSIACKCGAEVCRGVIGRPPLVDSRRNCTSKRTQPLSDAVRKQAADVRAVRACLWCNSQRDTCDLQEPCKRCAARHGNRKVPCIRIDESLLQKWNSSLISSFPFEMKSDMDSMGAQSIEISLGYDIWLGIDEVVVVMLSPLTGAGDRRRALYAPTLSCISEHVDTVLTRLKKDERGWNCSSPGILKFANEKFSQESTIDKAVKLIWTFRLLSEKIVIRNRINADTSILYAQIKQNLAQLCVDMQGQLLEQFWLAVKPNRRGSKGKKNMLEICVLGSILLIYWELHLAHIGQSSSGKEALWKSMCETANMPPKYILETISTAALFAQGELCLDWHDILRKQSAQFSNKDTTRGTISLFESADDSVASRFLISHLERVFAKCPMQAGFNAEKRAAPLTIESPQKRPRYEPNSQASEHVLLTSSVSNISMEPGNNLSQSDQAHQYNPRHGTDLIPPYNSESIPFVLHSHLSQLPTNIENATLCQGEQSKPKLTFPPNGDRSMAAFQCGITPKLSRWLCLEPSSIVPEPKRLLSNILAFWKTNHHIFRSKLGQQYNDIDDVLTMWIEERLNIAKLSPLLLSGGVGQRVYALSLFRLAKVELFVRMQDLDTRYKLLAAGLGALMGSEGTDSVFILGLSEIEKKDMEILCPAD